MNKNNIALVQNSWAKVTWDSPKLVSIFHIELFNRDHEAQALFVGEKGNKVTGMMRAIDVAIHNLHDWESFTPFLQDFGRRHIAYGVLESHHQSFCDALLSTLEQMSGDKLTPDTREAWIDLYQAMEKIMVDAPHTQH